jgi:predicted pyridoxine 5'-phosphate oxidase superfamily flavin-nucleotide-binding protein
LGYVATVCPDGTPNLSPKGTTADDHLIFGGICSPATVANLRTNPSVEINVVDVFARKGFRLKGRAQVVTEGRAGSRHSHSTASFSRFIAPSTIANPPAFATKMVQQLSRERSERPGRPVW